MPEEDLIVTRDHVYLLNMIDSLAMRVADLEERLQECRRMCGGES